MNEQSWLFRELNAKETLEFRQFAEDFFKKESIALWHPITRRKLLELIEKSL